MQDLENFDTAASAETGAVMEVITPSGDPLLWETGPKKGQPVTITLAGQDSARWRKAQNQLTNKRLAQRGRRNQTLDAAEIDKDTVTVLANCTIAWDGIMLRNEEIPCNVETARDVYTRFRWLREQVESFIDDRQNFLKASRTSSSSSSRPNALDPSPALS